jgi:hypothetical protein
MARLIQTVIFSSHIPCFLAFTNIPRNNVSSRHRHAQVLPWRQTQKHTFTQVSLPALISLDESEGITPSPSIDSDSDPAKESSLLLTLYQKIMEKAGSIDESRYTFPAISSGQVSTLYRYVFY